VRGRARQVRCAAQRTPSAAAFHVGATALLLEWADEGSLLVLARWSGCGTPYPTPYLPARAGQPELCEEFWAPGAAGAAAALRHLLDAARGLFPAAPGPLLRLLAALAVGRRAAAAASAYLGRLPAVACVHARDDPRVAPLEGDGGGGGDTNLRVAVAAIPLAGGVVLPEARARPPPLLRPD